MRRITGARVRERASRIIDKAGRRRKEWESE